MNNLSRRVSGTLAVTAGLAGLTGVVGSHRMSLDDGAQGYEMFTSQSDGCVRAVFSPSA